MQSIPFTPKNDPLEPGMRVRILAGPFAEFRGILREIDPRKERAVVAVNFFGKEVVAEFSYAQITGHGV